MSLSGPTPPMPIAPETTRPHLALYEAVQRALTALPSFFRSDLVISGVLATDLFTFNTSLGATIESQVVEGLNELREMWDPERHYVNYRFVRQSQQFPDVILRSVANASDIVMGIELKGWYVLAKEGEPSFRYRVTPAVCAPQDLLVVFPWALSQVTSGSPQLFPPYIEGARNAALKRNDHWQTKKGKGDNGIKLSSSTQSYPKKSEPISDVPNSDSGDNFGRFARTGLMDAYITILFSEELSGIPLWAWQKFFAIFDDKRTDAKIERKLGDLARQWAKTRVESDEFAEQLFLQLQALLTLLQKK